MAKASPSSEAARKKSAKPDFLIEISKHIREVGPGQPSCCRLSS
jgi:hypothetical protein